MTTTLSEQAFMEFYQESIQPQSPAENSNQTEGAKLHHQQLGAGYSSEILNC